MTKPLVVLTDEDYHEGNRKAIPGFAKTYFRPLSDAERRRGLVVPRSHQRLRSKVMYFPPGHPQANVVYFDDPVLEDTYYPAADYHRRTFERKFSEALRFVIELGATDITVEHVAGWNREFAASISVPIFSGQVSAEDAHSSSLLFHASLPGTLGPSVPNDLAWLPHEPTWQAFADARIKRGLTSVTLAVDYESDFGVEADLGKKLGPIGYKLGGTFKAASTTRWRLNGVFGPFEPEQPPPVRLVYAAPGVECPREVLLSDMDDEVVFPATQVIAETTGLGHMESFALSTRTPSRLFLEAQVAKALFDALDELGADVELK